MMSYNAQIDKQNNKEYSELRCSQERGHTAIIGCAPIISNHLINARLSSTKSLLKDDSNWNTEIPPNEAHKAVHASIICKPHSFLLKLGAEPPVGTTY